MKIGLFGSYNRLNFGDDLLAYYISYILSKQFDVTVLSDRKKLQLPLTVNMCSDIREFVVNSDILVLGGGGFLTSIPDSQLEDQLKSILEFATPLQLPLYILSIGGDQKSADEVWNYLGDGRKSIFNYTFLHKCIVRTHEEFCQNDTRFVFHEDVLWNSIDDLSSLTGLDNTSQKYTIGIHLSSIPVLRVVTALAELLSFLTFRRVHFVYFKTHDPTINKLEELGALLPFKSKTVQHSGNVLFFIEELKTVDILISAKMHIGLLCLSLGKPFISFGGPVKAQNLLKKLGLDSCIFHSSPRLLFMLLIKLVLKKNYRSSYSVPTSEIDNIKIDSKRNFNEFNLLR